MNENELGMDTGVDSVSDNDPGTDTDIDTDLDVVLSVDSVSGSDLGNGDISAGDIGGYVSDFDKDGFDGFGVVEIDNELLSSIREEVSMLNITVFLIFIFLLFSWTEKKFSVIVNRFTRERKWFDAGFDWFYHGRTDGIYAGGTGPVYGLCAGTLLYREYCK